MRDWATINISRSDDQVSCDLQGETAILRLSSGVYYGLNAIGTRIWTLLAEPRTLTQLVDAIAREYAVDRDTCTRDIVGLLEDLDANGLLTVATP